MKAEFEAATSGNAAVYLICARGFVDRTVFGFLSTRAEYLARTWTSLGPVQPIALVETGRGPSNMAPAYAAAGFTIATIPEGAKRIAHGGVGSGTDPFDGPRRGEDELIHAL